MCVCMYTGVFDGIQNDPTQRKFKVFTTLNSNYLIKYKYKVKKPQTIHLENEPKDMNRHFTKEDI